MSICPALVLLLSWSHREHIGGISYPTPTYNILCILSRDFEFFICVYAKKSVPLQPQR